MKIAISKGCKTLSRKFRYHYKARKMHMSKNKSRSIVQYMFSLQIRLFPYKYSLRLSHLWETTHCNKWWSIIFHRTEISPLFLLFVHEFFIFFGQRRRIVREIMTSFDFSKSINCLALTSKCPKASFILETNNFETGKLLKDFTRCLMYE